MDAKTFLKEVATKLAELRNRPCLLFVSNHIHRSDCQKTHVVLNKIRDSHESEVDLIVESPGGDLHAAFTLIRRIRRQFDEVGIFVPRYAKSAATLLCLGADELVLGDLGELGPLDAQLAEPAEEDAPKLKSALNRMKALEQLRRYALESYDLSVLLILKRSGMKIGQASRLATDFTRIVAEPLFGKIDPLKVAESERSLQVGVEYGVRILTRYMDRPEEEAKELVETLVRSYPSHGFVLDSEELERVDLPVREPSQGERDLLDKLWGGLSALSGEVFEVVSPPSQMSLDAENVSDEAEAGTEDAAVEEDEAEEPTGS